jgi:hypothetical protein
MENMMKAVRTQLMIASMAGSLLAAAPGTATAQTGPDSEKFLDAIEKQKSDEVIDLVTRKGRAIINVRGYSGATPLTTAMVSAPPNMSSICWKMERIPTLPTRMATRRC